MRKKNVIRVPAGLISCNILSISIRKKLKDKLMKIFNWIEKDDNIKERCIYGIDEIILLDLFEDINTNNLATINSFTINYFNTKLSLLLHNNLYLQLKI